MTVADCDPISLLMVNSGRLVGYKAGTVTEVTWLSEEKAACPKSSLLSPFAFLRWLSHIILCKSQGIRYNNNINNNKR